MRAFRILLSILATITLIVLAAIGAAFIGLNTSAGRIFAEREINRLAGPDINIQGLAGHFPADIKIASVTLADSKGIYATGSNLELRWRPQQLLQRNIAVSSLTADALDIQRAPVSSSKKSSGTLSLPKFRLDADHIAIASLHAGAALVGEDVTLKLTGATHFADQTHGDITLDAATLDDAANYHLNAAIDPKNVGLNLHVLEPPNGLLGHYAGPQVQAPLAITATLTGPRDAAALSFQMALGAARLDAAGTLGLNPDNPKADVVFTVPALAPLAAMAQKNVAGNTKLHLVIAHLPAGGARLALDGEVALTAAPGGIAKLIGQEGKFSLLAILQGQSVALQSFNVSGAEFSAGITGSIAQSGVNLSTQLQLNQVSEISPTISGNVDEEGTIIGTLKDFSVNALLTGHITQRNISSGPFSIILNAQHLPSTPQGTLTGSGTLENSPLLLDAEFSRDAQGTENVKINNALWRSLNAKADLSLASGATLPTGMANFTCGSLADFAAFSPIPLKGSVTADFSHLNGETFKLDLIAKNLVAAPQLGAINANIHALGPTSALTVQAQADVAKILTAPAKFAMSGVLNLDARSANLTSFTGAWRDLNANLTGPAQIATQPGISVRHLSLDLNGGKIALDGTLTPKLAANITVQNLPASLASLASPSIHATGTLSATAAVAGSLQAPQGKFTLDARSIKLHTGPTAAIPAANLAATASISGKTANIDAKLDAGPNIALTVNGLAPLAASGTLNLHLAGRTDLRLLDPILAANGSIVRGVVALNLDITGNIQAPRANGTITLAQGSVENIGSGLSLTKMSAAISADGQRINLQQFQATAGKGSITGHGDIDLGQPSLPLNLTLTADHASPVSSDILTEILDANLSLTGALRGKMALGGDINIDHAEINIPKSLPPSVANLTILNAGEKPPPPPPPPPPIALALTVRATNQIFVRGDGLFAELGGKLRIGGTAADPDPEGGFELIRGNFSLAGKTLEFTQGTVRFNGAGFMPVLDLEASTTTTTNTTATLTIGGTAAKPTITLSSTPPLPSDEILSQLLFNQSTTSLTPFQAASLAAALAQISGLGGGLNPLDSVRNALGLDQLSLAGSGSGAPSLQAGRYIAPGVYVSASQATNGQGTQASVEINLYKGLKLQTSTGVSNGDDSSSVGLTYQFNY